MPADADAPAAIAGDLLRALQNLGGSFLAVVQTRLELLSTEFEEEWLRLAGFVLIALAALFCIGVVIVLAEVFAVAAFWDSYRLSAIVALGAVSSQSQWCFGECWLCATLRSQRSLPPA